MNGKRLLGGACLLMLLSCAGTIAPVRDADRDSLKSNAEAAKAVKIAIVYQSKYGSTRQYAEWIRQATGGDLVNVEEGGKPDLAKYDILIIGGYVRTGKIVIAPFIRDRWSVMEGKKVILFTTSGTPPGHPKLQGIYEQSLPEAIRKSIRYFPLPGRISRKDLTFFDRFLIVIGKLLERDETLARDMGKDYDGVRQEHLAPLLAHVEMVKKPIHETK